MSANFSVRIPWMLSPSRQFQSDKCTKCRICLYLFERRIRTRVPIKSPANETSAINQNYLNAISEATPPNTRRFEGPILRAFLIYIRIQLACFGFASKPWLIAEFVGATTYRWPSCSGYECVLWSSMKEALDFNKQNTKRRVPGAGKKADVFRLEKLIYPVAPKLSWERAWQHLPSSGGCGLVVRIKG